MFSNYYQSLLNKLKLDFVETEFDNTFELNKRLLSDHPITSTSIFLPSYYLYFFNPKTKQLRFFKDQINLMSVCFDRHLFLTTFKKLLLHKFIQYNSLPFQKDFFLTDTNFQLTLLSILQQKPILHLKIKQINELSLYYVFFYNLLSFSNLENDIEVCSYIKSLKSNKMRKRRKEESSKFKTLNLIKEVDKKSSLKNKLDKKKKLTSKDKKDNKNKTDKKKKKQKKEKQTSELDDEILSQSQSKVIVDYDLEDFIELEKEKQTLIKFEWRELLPIKKLPSNKSTVSDEKLVERLQSLYVVRSLQNTLSSYFFSFLKRNFLISFKNQSNNQNLNTYIWDEPSYLSSFQYLLPYQDHNKIKYKLDIVWLQQSQFITNFINQSRAFDLNTTTTFSNNQKALKINTLHKKPISRNYTIKKKHQTFLLVYLIYNFKLLNWKKMIDLYTFINNAAIVKDKHTLNQILQHTEQLTRRNKTLFFHQPIFSFSKTSAINRKLLPLFSDLVDVRFFEYLNNSLESYVNNLPTQAETEFTSPENQTTEHNDFNLLNEPFYTSFFSNPLYKLIININIRSKKSLSYSKFI